MLCRCKNCGLNWQDEYRTDGRYSSCPECESEDVEREMEERDYEMRNVDMELISMGCW